MHPDHASFASLRMTTPVLGNRSHHRSGAHVLNHYDVIIIGTGAGGGTLAYRLAPSGKRILLLERGDYVPREKDNWSTRAVNVEGKYQHEGGTGATSDGQAAPSAHQLLRRRQHQVLRRGAVPAAPRGLRRAPPPRRRLAGLADRLRRARAVLHRGRAPLPGARRARRGSDRAAGQRALPVSRRSATSRASSSCSDDFARLGLPAVPRAARHHARRAEPARRAAASAATPATAIPAWSTPSPTRRWSASIRRCEHPNVTLLTGAYVSRLETSASGREVTRVVVERDGARETLLAPTSSSSPCGAINSAALLLRSANDRHPRGLANGSDVVGRHYMGHINSVLMALSQVPEPDRLPEDARRSTTSTSARQDWAYPMGHISFVGKLDGVTLSAGAPAIAPGWTLDLMAKHSLDFWLTSEDLPDPGQPRDARPRRATSSWPTRRTTRRGTSGSSPSSSSLMQQQTQLRACTATSATRGSSRATCSSASAFRWPASRTRTARSASAAIPKTSALDANCRAHDVDNLYVVDGSFFPSSGAVNPALTIMANALRVGDHLLERLGASSEPAARRHARGVGMNALVAASRRSRASSWRPLVDALARRRAAALARPRASRRPAAAVGAVAGAAAVGPGGRDGRAHRVGHGPLGRLLHRRADFEKVSRRRGRRATPTSGCRASSAPALRVVRLRLGDEYARADRVPGAARAGPLPADSRSNDRWFQHVAIIVSDMDRAYARLRAVQGRSTRRPARSGCRTGTRTPRGIQAFYFRDPDGHPLEILAVPAGQGRPRSGTRPADRLFLGHRPHRDRRRRHRAEPARSTATCSGFRVAGESENYGAEQEHLNNVFGRAAAHHRRCGPPAGPGIEFLEYLAPARRPARTRPTSAPTTWCTGRPRVVVPDVGRGGGGRTARQVPPHLPGAGRASRHRARIPRGVLVRDPDGHVVQLVEHEGEVHAQH